jgi:hypothetical protein
MADNIFLIFTIILAAAGLSFFGYYFYRLDRTPEIKPARRNFNRALLGIGSLVFAVGTGISFLASAPLADWGYVIGLGGLALTMFLLAFQGYGVGFEQMEEDGVGFIRFFQLGSTLVICIAFVPAFLAFVTYSSRLS